MFQLSFAFAEEVYFLNKSLTLLDIVGHISSFFAGKKSTFVIYGLSYTKVISQQCLFAEPVVVLYSNQQLFSPAPVLCVTKETTMLRGPRRERSYNDHSPLSNRLMISGSDYQQFKANKLRALLWPGIRKAEWTAESVVLRTLYRQNRLFYILSGILSPA